MLAGTTVVVAAPSNAFSHYYYVIQSLTTIKVNFE